MLRIMLQRSSFKHLLQVLLAAFSTAQKHIRWHVTRLRVVESCFTSFLQWFSMLTTGLENMIFKTQRTVQETL